MTPRTLEICVDTIDGAIAAQAGGADRIELCAALSEGGLTPSAGLMVAASRLDIPCYAMIRPRSGLFVYSDADVQLMLDDLAAVKEADLAGVVLGAQKPDGTLDTAVLGLLLAAAEGLGATLHRVIDVVPDPLAALDQAIALGFERVLTSGGAATAVEGADRIQAMIRHAAGRIAIMPGSGLTDGNISDFVAQTGVREVHASCAAVVAGEESFSNLSPAGGRKETCKNRVKQMKRELVG
ncbi:copper homeostasis protein CutC [Aliiroseovarius zhejiangensis]|uniref:PF03932 family protein CutC n=1 Tax=Aliiroseovarius zhejiangensis TaxID=1632025 RepID=A0ABQ3IS62_9RHOB|nr:copper homeostasis protein CutC [Aliiroseovarius zhejiangensis]GHE92807.1 copper homeostasis protein CutC [Aliiroseovarius zhejiangensis]